MRRKARERYSNCCKSAPPLSETVKSVKSRLNMSYRVTSSGWSPAIACRPICDLFYRTGSKLTSCS